MQAVLLLGHQKGDLSALGIPSGEHGDEYYDSLLIVCSFFASNSYTMLRFVKLALYTLIRDTKMTSIFRTGGSTNSMA